ncbi:MAG: GNAT family N-acetyltransferase [Candidatus Bathyarchaeota archaeon]|nr:GNAT family N-acetyltransferase [Candidatus Bathyarchaeota archaeon]
MDEGSGVDIEVRQLRGGSESEACARMMAGSEPWITLERGYDESLEIISDPSREVYLAVIGGEIAGFVVLEMSGAFVGYVKSICVSSEWRGRGVGERLMAFAEERIFSEAPNVFLCVSGFNEGARRFYERLGYEVVGELRDYIVPGRSEILMRKSIAPLARFPKDDP